MCRILANAIVHCVVAVSILGVHAESNAKRTSAQDIEYDYESLAVASVLSSAEEAAKLSDVNERVLLLVSCVKLLPSGNRSDSIRLLNIALRDLKEWLSRDNVRPAERYVGETLRTKVLSEYAKLDVEKATALQKEEQTANEGRTDIQKSLKPNGGWIRAILDRRKSADQAAQIALSIIDTDPERALSIVVQSASQGIVSNSISTIFDKLRKSDRVALLANLQISLSRTLASTVTLDPFSLVYTSTLLQSEGKEIPQSTRRGFIIYLMNSLETWVAVVKDEVANGGVDPSYVSSSFTSISLSVRPAIVQYAPDDLPRVDVLLDQVSPFVSEKTRSQLQAFQPEKFEEPRDRLNDILKDPNPERRDLRLIGLVSQLLRNESEDSQKTFDLASDAISGFSDPDTKTAFTDLFMITRVNALVKQKDFIEAQRLTSSISEDETRAWALLALAAAATKSDKVLGFELLSNGLKALDKASPSPHKVELALIATSMLAKSDPQRAFDALSEVSRYANSSAAKVDPPAKPAVAFGLDAQIGDAHTRLGVFPESLSDVQIDSSVSTLGTNDWFRANQIADGIREPALRLRLKLEFARAVIAEGPKSQKKETKKKPVANN